MTNCPHCQKPLPENLSGTACPACHQRLPSAVIRAASPRAMETPALGQDRPVVKRPVTPTPSEDLWDDNAADLARPAKPTDPTLPTSVGRPGNTGARERRGATQVMGAKDMLEGPSGDETLALGPRLTGERVTNDLIADAGSSGERRIPTQPTGAGVPGATSPRGRANATMVGTAPLAPAPSAASAASAETADALAVPDTTGPAVTASATTSASATANASAPAATPPPVASPAGAAPTANRPAPSVPDARTTGRFPRATAPADPMASATTTSPQKPVLASDMLRDDLVPREPASVALRTTLGIAGVVLLAFAALSLRDIPQALSWSIPALTSLAVVLLPVPYGTRALLAFAPAWAALLMQSIAAPGAGVAAALTFTVTAGGLPAALFFRSFFRASRRARAFVAVALVCALVWLQLPGGGALYDSSGGAWGATHASALALIGVTFLSLLAFVGADTTAGCRAWATLAIAWAGFATLAQRLTAEHAVRSIDREMVIAALGTAALAAVTGLSGAALLAVYARPTEPRTGIGAAASQH